ncbi:hypothetical protein PAXRUDRAFT_822545 [Paxillus rubicundulus Ve08.2h10]|uniref:Uncharacterized protein n=1 Tax=Paxillus rubicundulus Ve08.2h10 TaxID=930991 RepID=A0A0D0DWD0_9AGAM|nr:hypothetical protein PAXRUDRAFT_822545 [Paxillus rubicundulus Ve08.2h10]
MWALNCWVTSCYRGPGQLSTQIRSAARLRDQGPGRRASDPQPSIPQRDVGSRTVSSWPGSRSGVPDSTLEQSAKDMFRDFNAVSSFCQGSVRGV